MRDLGLDGITQSYNLLLNLYRQTGNYEKLDNLMHEMETNTISFDKFTYTLWMNAYATNSDIKRMEKTLEKMESDPEFAPTWSIYASVANWYTKAGLLDKALAVLKKSEGLVTCHESNIAYAFLITLYTAMGNKNEVLRAWEVYKKKKKVFNEGYVSIITSLLKFDDNEGAEKVFEEWESQNSRYDVRVPNFLIGAYSREGLMERADNLVNRVILNGGKPDAWTWYYMTTGHLQNNETLKAVEAMKEAMKICRLGWNPSKETFAVCLDYLQREGDVEGAEEFIRLMREKNIVSVDVQQRSLNYVKDQMPNMDVSDEL